jgi:hypothetical protein
MDALSAADVGALALRRAREATATDLQHPEYFTQRLINVRPVEMLYKAPQRQRRGLFESCCW